MPTCLPIRVLWTRNLENVEKRMLAAGGVVSEQSKMKKPICGYMIYRDDLHVNTLG